jgi:hypothetical protein
MSQNQWCRGRATTVRSTARGVGVTYHGTLVALKEGQYVRLDSGGWRTATTKLRMNQFANQFCNSGFRVYQHKGEWYVENNVQHSTQPFEDGMQFKLGKEDVCRSLRSATA